nr:threonylcarbamoyl-AMP synthase [Bacillota bacterium]
MKVRLLSVRGLDRRDRDYRRVLQEAAAVLRAGGLVAFPTETVYGLGASIEVPGAVERIFAAKGRPPDNPLIVHVAGPDDARRLCTRWPEAAQAAADAFWPGPLTLILPRSSLVPEAVSAGLPTVAVRAPAHRVARDLIQLAGPLAAPSANRSGRPSPTRAEHVLAELGDLVDVVIDDGPTSVGVESTVVDLTGPVPLLLRPGGIGVDSLREVLGEVEVPLPWDPAGEGAAADPRLARSPGTRYRHYAPSTRLVVVRAGPARDLEAAVEGVRREIRRLRQEGLKVAVLGADEVTRALSGEADAVVPLGPYTDSVQAARRLFDALRRVDDAGVDAAVAHTYPPLGVGLAVNDRLLRAATEVRGAGAAGGGEAAAGGNRGAAGGGGPVPRRVLLVCTGNTCRSPMAAALLRALAVEAGLDLEVRSAGTGALEGAPATPEAAAALAQRGIALGDHRARLLQEADLAWADLVLTMTRGQRDRLRDAYPQAAGKIWTLGEQGGRPERDVEDPIGGGEARYRATLDEIETLLRRLLARWRGQEGT